MVWLAFMANQLFVSYLMPNPFYIYIKYIWFGLVVFYGISTIVGYLMPNPLYIYILNIYDLVWLGFMVYQLFVSYLLTNPLYTYCETFRPHPTTLSLSVFWPFHFLVGRWSTSGWGGNAHFFTYTRIRSRETGENRKTNEQTKLGVTKSRGRYATLHACSDYR